MKRFFCGLVLLAVLTGCGNESSVKKEENALEAGVRVYEQAIVDIRSAQNEEELALVVESTFSRIDSIGVSDELKACMALLESGDSLALKEIEPSVNAVLDAADRYMDAVTVAIAELSQSNH